ncbi:hypothetical protein BASA81_012425 [Batrachochytrium salamandrivorans]|nr:hypothetical protein BASA81_012425 [Batrachochytrium salamandrivorans]
MGKPRNQFEVSPDLEEYMSDDEETGSELNQPTLEEIRKQEAPKTVLIGNVPVAAAEKLGLLKDKLKGFIVSKIGEEAKEPLVFIPVDASGSSTGVAFAYLDSLDNAKLCVSALDGLKFGKNNLRFYLYSQIGEEVPTIESLVERQQNKSEEALDLPGWLLDGREQFVLRYADQTVVKWCESLAFNAESEHVYGGERDKAQGKTWCRKNVAWSPKGTYLATFHDQGLVLWGGPEFEKVGRFSHSRMTHAEVSPCERYVVTFEELGDTSSQKENLLVWSIKTQQVKRAFHVGGFVSELQWPVLKWSFDGQFVARQVENGIAVYESSTMKLVDGKPLACKGLVSFEWSPTENKVAFWSPEEGNVPARICLMDPVKRIELRSKIVFSVQAVKLYWQSNGDFLCAQVTRTKKKTVFTSFELFRVRDNGVPNETMNVNETVGSFAFEPQGVRFAIVHTATPDAEVQQKMHTSFYSLGQVRNGKEIALVHRLESRACNTVVFAPHQQGVVILASLEQFTIGSGTGALEFFDLETKTVLNQVEHYNCSTVQWDASGRFAVSVCCQPSFSGNVPVRYTVDNGYRIWSFQGQRLQDVAIHDLYQVVWRPRPKSVLTEDEMEDVKRKLTSSMRKMEKDDALNRKRRAAAANAARIIELEAFRSVAEARSQSMTSKRTSLGFPPVLLHAATKSSEELLDEIVEKVEELLSEKTEPYVPGSSSLMDE